MALEIALAARGYYEAFQAVKECVAMVLRGDNPGTVADDHHGAWYRALWAPSVTAGLVTPRPILPATAAAPSMSAGPCMSRRRTRPVRDLMPALFDLLREEDDPVVRAVLGHFVFVHIHPYMDGNGRIGRLLMNLMLAAGGYPWKVIPVERRDDYMAALEAASTWQDIAPFAAFLAALVQDGLEGRPPGKVPA